jgi:uncharacterized membrane protein YcaP (DUF421 family)
MAAGRQSPGPQIGEDERFDRAAHRLRVIAWWIVLPLLVVGAFTNQVQDHAVPSTVLRAAIIYGFVLLVVRLAGKRTLAELSTFDLVVLLIMSEAIQPALVADDTRITSAMLLVGTFVAIDFLLAILKDKSPSASRALDDIPTILVREGKPNQEALTRERVDEDDIMEAARRDHALERFDQIRFAILERTGGISIIPWPEVTPRAR